jgi:hypothetical protein
MLNFRRHCRLGSITILAIIALVWSSLRAEAQVAGEEPGSQAAICSSDKRVALETMAVTRLEDQAEMLRAKAAAPMESYGDIVPKFAKYAGGAERSALLVFQIGNGYICSFLFQGPGDQGVHYTRQPYEKGELETLGKALAKQLQVTSAWNGRAVRKHRSKPPVQEAGPDEPRSLEQTVAALSALFFPEAFRSLLKDVKQLSIIPVRGMSEIPVAMLEPFGDDQKAVERFSISFLAFMTDVERAPAQTTHGFVNPVIVGNPRPSIDREYEFVPLAGAEKEARFAHEKLGGKLLLTKAATKAVVKEAARQADLIYFASHAYSDPGDGMDNSFIMLADSRLTAREIQIMTLGGHPVVVLSACQTGEGYIMEAGVVGLARGFQLAGAENTVMSLWVIDDAATQELMRRFIENAKARPIAEALRLAMQKFRESDPDPAHWAAFNVYGNQAGSAPATAPQ